MVRALILAALFAGCAEPATPTPDAGAALGPPTPIVYGTVYTCSVADKPGWENEWCWTGDAYNLGQRTRTSNCHPTPMRPYCNYRCPNTVDTFADCIALNGCYCP